jgi:hypothetical protein
MAGCREVRCAIAHTHCACATEPPHGVRLRQIAGMAFRRRQAYGRGGLSDRAHPPRGALDADENLRSLLRSELGDRLLRITQIEVEVAARRRLRPRRVDHVRRNDGDEEIQDARHQVDAHRRHISARGVPRALPGSGRRTATGDDGRSRPPLNLLRIQALHAAFRLEPEATPSNIFREPN